MIFSILALVALLGAALYLIHRERTIATSRIREHERLARLYQQRETELLDRLAHAYDRPWTVAPAEEPEPAPEEDEDEPELTWDTSFIEEEGALTY